MSKGACAKCRNHFSMNSSSTDALSDYNAYRYDPLGLIAHVYHSFFGPEWQPTIQHHLEGLWITGQPRYGPPVPSQADKLPKLFTPWPPPLYFGAPSPPYITGPLLFDPKLLSGAIFCLVCKRNTNPSKTLCYKRIHDMEVMNRGRCVPDGPIHECDHTPSILFGRQTCCQRL